MAEQNIKNSFSKGAVDTDTNHKLVAEGTVVGAKNVVFLGNGNNGTCMNIPGNSIEYDVTAETGEHTFLGATTFKNKFYLFYASESDTEDLIIEWDSKTKSKAYVLRGDLGFRNEKGSKISANVVDDIYLYFTGSLIDANTNVREGYFHPKRLHIDLAKGNYDTYTDNYDLNNILPRPSAPEVYVETTSTTITENRRLEIGSYSFALRFKNKFNEWSPLGFSSNGINITKLYESGHQIKIVWDSSMAGTITKEVTEVELYLFNRLTNSFYLINKDDVADTTDHEFVISDSSHLSILGEPYASTSNYNTPLLAVTQTLVQNTLVYGNTKYQYDEIYNNNAKIPITYHVNQANEAEVVSDIAIVVDTPLAADIGWDMEAIHGSTTNPETGLTVMNGQAGRLCSVAFMTGTDAPENNIYSAHFQLYNSFNRSSGNTTDVTTFDLLNERMVREYSNMTLENLSGHIVTFTNMPGGATWLRRTTSAKTGLMWKNNFYVGIIFMDDYGRNTGVTNVTLVEINRFNPSSGLSRNISTVLTGAIVPPSWATKYSIAKTIPTQNYEILRYEADANISPADGTTWYALTMDGNSTEYIRSVEITQKVHQDVEPDQASGIKYKEGSGLKINPRNWESKSSQQETLDKEAEAKEFDYYISQDITLYELNTEDEYRMSIISPASAQAADPEKFDSNYVYIKASIAPATDASYHYLVPSSISQSPEVFYEGEVFGISEGEYLGDHKVLSFYDMMFIDDNYMTNYVDASELYKINTLFRPFLNFDVTTISGNYMLQNSLKYSPSSNFNGLAIFNGSAENYLDLATNFGEVIEVMNKNNNLLVGQKLKWSNVLINKTTSPSGAASQSTAFLAEAAPYSGEFGLSHIDAVADWGFRTYGVDSDRGVMTRLSQDGLTPINKGRDSEITQLLKDYGGDIIGVYNPYEKTYMMSLVDLNKTYVFSELNGQQVGEYDYAFHGSIEGTSEIYLVDDEGSLWKHNVLDGPRNTIFGKPLISNVSYIANQHPSVVKLFASISLEATHSCDVTITTPSSSAIIPASAFVNKEGIWFADIPRDMSGGGDGIEGGYVKGRYAKVDISSTETEEFEIFAVNLAYNVSSNNF